MSQSLWQLYGEIESFSINLVLLDVYRELINMSVTPLEVTCRTPFVIQKSHVVPHIIKSSMSQYETEQQSLILQKAVFTIIVTSWLSDMDIQA
jgi:hypothetical protein